MTAIINTSNAVTAEHQLIAIALELKGIYESKLDSTGELDRKFSNRVQMDIDYSGASVSLRFRLPIEFRKTAGE